MRCQLAQTEDGLELGPATFPQIFWISLSYPRSCTGPCLTPLPPHVDFSCLIGSLGLCFSFSLVGSKACAVLGQSPRGLNCLWRASRLAGARILHREGVPFVCCLAASSPPWDSQGRHSQQIPLGSEFVDALGCTTSVGLFGGETSVPSHVGIQMIPT